jgi:riboflavin kinase/FMN adenylyltransferase
MEIIDSLEKLPNDSFSITIGNFDGVHLGHKFLLGELKKKSSNKLGVITFIPHPKIILGGISQNFLINNYEQRRDELEKAGVDVLIELRFDRKFSNQSPKEFLSKLITNKDRVKSFYLGHDFKYGSNQEGDFDMAKSILGEEGIIVEKMPEYQEKVSSSIIRQHIKTGEIEEAHSKLGREFFLEGIVVKGEGRGTQIGFPTANIQIENELIKPQKGVYITTTIYNGMTYESITNVGVNPTFKDDEILNVETNIFDFNNMIYGEKIVVKFEKKLRSERRFENVNALVKQIAEDVDAAKKAKRK